VVAQLRRACDTSIATLRSFENPIHGAAKESNLPSAGLPLPAGFEVPDSQAFCACFGAFLFVCVHLGKVRFAEFGTRMGTSLASRIPRSSGWVGRGGPKLFEVDIAPAPKPATRDSAPAAGARCDDSC
jgi:hypothetical protein